MNKILINKQQLKGLLEKISGTTFATITTVTNIRVSGGNNTPKYRKLSKLNVCLGFNYANSVNRELSKEGKLSDFKPNQRFWGERLPGTPLVKYNDKYYLEVKPQKSLISIFFDEKGNRIKKDNISNLISKYYSNAEQQGVSREIKVRDYSLDSIREIKIGGCTYKIK